MKKFLLTAKEDFDVFVGTEDFDVLNVINSFVLFSKDRFFELEKLIVFERMNKLIKERNSLPFDNLDLYIQKIYEDELLCANRNVLYDRANNLMFLINYSKENIVCGRELNSIWSDIIKLLEKNFDKDDFLNDDVIDGLILPIIDFWIDNDFFDKKFSTQKKRWSFYQKECPFLYNKKIINWEIKTKQIKNKKTIKTI